MNASRLQPRRGQRCQRSGSLQSSSLAAAALVAALALVAAACRTQPQAPRPDPSAQLRSEIARAEARRGAGVDELLPMIAAGGPLRASLAVRALGRIGGAKARTRLLAGVSCPVLAAGGDPSAAPAGAVRAGSGGASCLPGEAQMAAAALGVSAALDELPAGELTQISQALAELLGRTQTAADQATVLEALGRAGLEATQPAIATYLARGGAAGEAAAIALGRHGRRGLVWSAEVRAAVLPATTHHDAPLRYAATWALSREAQPPPASDPASGPVARALALRLTDADAEIRAAAAAALSRRKLTALAGEALAAALVDADWRVAIEAMRALTAGGDAASADLIAAAVGARMKSLAADTGGKPGDSQVVVEGLRQLQAHGGRGKVATELRAALVASEAVKVRAKVAAGWIRCLAQAALERASAAPDPGKLIDCGATELPAAYAAGLVAEQVAASVGAPAVRAAAVERLWVAKDLRVKTAALRALPPTLAGVDPALAAADLARLAEAIGSSESAVASAAIEGLAGLWPADGLPANLDPSVRASVEALAQAAVTRAGNERDPELGAALLDFIAERKLRIGEPSCRAAATSGSPVIAKAAARCLAALEGSPVPTPAEPPAAEPPPVDLALGAGLGTRWRWKVTTEHGVVEIDLDSSAAPWHVAAIVTLTQRHFYDGLEFHRVVPNFVVQGGDPTQTGSGGPGFSLPAEPGSRLDGDTYKAGAVGFADAGKDSGGSQWFAMHSRAPHLEGRYTRVGQVVSGHDAIARLLVGDRVVTAQVIAVAR